MDFENGGAVVHCDLKDQSSAMQLMQFNYLFVTRRVPVHWIGNTNDDSC